MTDPTALVYGRIGAAGFEMLVHAFYARVKLDDILAPLYPPDDFEGAEQRLRSFLIYRFGGPETYLAERGAPRLRMRHAPFRVDQAARDRWVALMEQAVQELAPPADVEPVLLAYLRETATFLINSP
jgi:hemoglobin